MYPLGTENPWLYQQGFNRVVDLCVWVLEKDGLQIPPFSTHPDGDGMLRKAGIQVSEWQSWITKIVDLQSQQTQILQQQARSHQGQAAMPTFLPEAQNPLASWPASISVKERLGTMWEQYKQLSHQRRTWEQPLAKQRRANGINQRLWADLQLYKSHLPSLMIYLVDYSQPVEYLIPPISSILTLNSHHLDSEDFRQRVLRTAERLALA